MDDERCLQERERESVSLNYLSTNSMLYYVVRQEERRGVRDDFTIVNRGNTYNFRRAKEVERES